MNALHDVIVVGAGPGGSATAHYLAKRGLDVVLLDRADFPRDKTCGDGLTPRALDVLGDMDILQDVYELGFRVNGVELHGSMGNSMQSPIPAHEAYPNHMVIAPRLKLDDLIRQRAEESGVAFHSPVRVRSIAEEGEHVLIQSSDQGENRTYKARVVILAVGANTRLLTKLGILKQQPPVIRAARAYYEGVSGLSDHVQAHFEEVPLPGYGWVFPISDTTANIGVGYWKSFWPWHKAPASAGVALDRFIQRNAKLQAMTKEARLVGPVKGYPLRVDFASAPTCRGRVLLVGESAGLVSPLTGEGIDFALESGKLAAEFVAEKFAQGDLTANNLAGYDAMLRAHFQKLFVFLAYIRRLYINPFLMNKAILATREFGDVREVLVKVMLGEEDAASMIKFDIVRKIILGF